VGAKQTTPCKNELSDSANEVPHVDCRVGSQHLVEAIHQEFSLSRRVRQTVSGWVAEFLLIVLGVLVALAADNWLQDRREAASSWALVTQLSVDTEANLRLLSDAIEYEGTGLASIEALMESRIAGVQLSEDSLRVLYLERHIFQTQPLHLVLGTLSALADLGGAAHIEDQDLRLGILNYATRLKINQEGYAQTQSAWAAHVDELSALYQAATGISDPLTLHRLFLGPLSPDVIRHLEYVRGSRVNMVWSVNQMIEATNALAVLLSEARD
jgi:hypothetical protein